MKRQEIFVLIMATVTVLMATKHCPAHVNLIGSDVGDGRLMIGYELSSGFSMPPEMGGIGLSVTLSNGVTVAGGQNVVSASPHFSVYPDYTWPDPSVYNIGDGHPLANSGEVGPVELPTSNFSISMGAPYLNDSTDPYEPDYSPFDFNLDASEDILDLRMFFGQWLMNNDPGPWGFTDEFLWYDFNNDYYVNLLDYTIMVDIDSVPTTITDLITLQLDFNGAESTEVTIDLDPLRGAEIGGSWYPPNNSPFDSPITLTVYAPEPTTLILLGLGGLMLRRQR